MKKQLLYSLYIFLFLFSTCIYSQVPVGEYKVKVEGTGYHSDNATCDTRVEVSVTLNDNSVLKVVELPWYPNGQQFSINGERNFTASKKISSFYFYAQRSWSNIWGCRDPQTGSYSKSIAFPYNCTIYNSSERGNNTAGSGLWEDYVNVTSIPLLTIVNVDPANNFLASDYKTIINSHTGFAANEYRWEYSTDGASFNPLPQYNGMSSINVNAVDILGVAVEQSFGNTIFIKQKSACGNESNIVQYRVLKSAPKVINHGPSVKTTCYDSNDGQYRLYFDRPLNSSANEYISIGLTNVATGIPINSNFTNITQLNPDNSFNLIGLPAGNYELKIIGKYNGTDTYSETTATPITLTILKNAPVDFSITKTDVWCYQGTDGVIQITASGGTLSNYEYQVNGGAWTPFASTPSFTETVTGLVAGTYTIKVRDGNECVAKVQVIDAEGNIGLGAEKELSLTLTAPQNPLTIDYTLAQEPTYNGATNGKLVAKVDGGTIFDNNTYWYEWKNSQGQVIPATTQFTAGSFYITLEGIPAETYYLTVRDKNYTNATDKVNCTIVESERELTQPDPLTAVIELVQPISCYNGNEFGDATDVNPQDLQWDESQDGILKVVANGGKPFTGTQNGGRPYKYTWKKQNSAGVWEIMPNLESTYPLLSDGNYAVNVEDANGIIIGVYQNNALVTATDVVYYLQQPEQLVIAFESTPATCAGGDGTAKAIVSGGTAPYTYSWTNGETTSDLSNLSAMPYFVTVTDARGCLVQGTVVVGEPEHINITENITPLLCYNASDASIEVSVTGGTLPYQFIWSNGATTSSVSNLSTGTYNVTITDAQSCSYVRSYTISNPDEIIIDLGEDRTLCNGQTLELDATITDEPGTQYSWIGDNGFSSSEAKVTLTEPGIYAVTATTPKGCKIFDSVTISRLNLDIDSEFLLTTQAYVNEEVILVNTSNPKGVTTEWIVENQNITVVDENTDYITLRFPQQGSFTITLKQTQGECFMLYNKEIIVEANSGQYNPTNANAGFIKEFTVAPNPSSGNFDVIVKLEEASPIKLRLFSLAGQTVQPEKSLPASKVHSVNYNIQMPSGTYVLVLETPYQVLTKKLIIQ